METVFSIPTIEVSDGYSLRPLLITDSVSLFPTFRDCENHKYTLFEPLESVEQTEHWIEGVLRNPAWAVASPENKAIGFVMYHKINRVDMSCLIAYHLNKEYWGRGIVPSSVLLTDDYMFQNAQIIQIAATVKPENTQSQRCLEKAGYCFLKTINNYVSSAINDHSRVRLFYVKDKPSA